MPRPTYWNEERKSECTLKILARLRAGESVRSILDTADRKEYPSNKVWLQWIESDDELKTKYRQAVEVTAEATPENVVPEPSDVMVYFETIVIPNRIVQLTGETVSDINAFINHYKSIINSLSEAHIKLQAIDRLEKLKQALLIG
jgi:hypothetical protein